MKCPYCGAEESKVIDSRPTEDNERIRRRRECLNCHMRFTTYEVVETVPLVVIKKDNSREPFDRQKLFNAMLRACAKRPVSYETLERAVSSIEQSLFSSYDREIPSVRIGELTMEELKKAGKIRAIGLSNFSLEEMKAAMRFGQVDVIQPCYSLLWRYDEALLEFSRKQEISVIPYSTLAQGLLTGKYQKGAVFTDGRARAALFQPENYDRCLEVTDVLSQISAKYGKTPAQGAIAWLLQTQGITAPIVGAKNGRQAQENLKAAGWQFSKEDYDVIDRASRRFMEGLPHYTLFFNTETTN